MASIPLGLASSFLFCLLSEAVSLQLGHPVTLSAGSSRQLSFRVPGSSKGGLPSDLDSQGQLSFVELGKGRQSKSKKRAKEKDEDADSELANASEESQSQEEGSQQGSQSESQEEEEEEAFARKGASSSQKKVSDKGSQISAGRQGSSKKSVSTANSSSSDAFDEEQGEGSGVAEEEHTRNSEAESGIAERSEAPNEPDEGGSAAAADEAEGGSVHGSQSWKEEGSAKVEPPVEESTGVSKRGGRGGKSEKDRTEEESEDEESMTVSSNASAGSSRSQTGKGKKSRRRDRKEEDGSSSVIESPPPPKRAHSERQAKEAESLQASHERKGGRAPLDPDAPRLGYKSRGDVCSAIGCKEVVNRDEDDSLQGCLTTVACAHCSGSGVAATHKSCRNWKMSGANEIVLANGIFRIQRGVAKIGDEILVRVAWDRSFVIGVNVCAPDLRQTVAITKNTSPGGHVPIFRIATVQLTAQRSMHLQAQSANGAGTSGLASVSFTVEFPGKEQRKAIHSLSAELHPVCFANKAHIEPVQLQANGVSRMFSSSWFSFPAFTTPSLATSEIVVKLHCERDDCASDTITGCIRLLCSATLPQVEAKLHASSAVSTPVTSMFHPGMMPGQLMGAGVSPAIAPQLGLFPGQAGMMPMQQAGVVPLMPAVRPVGMGAGRFWMMPRFYVVRSTPDVLAMIEAMLCQNEWYIIVLRK
ncbi:hypothetical protein TGRUB_225330 [Toxoplasma gondii RUB]|uniref:Transmembrane protein n=1 Tax=Toxoplasma gondii RUB TaxID=935652 RepID=A0A086LVY1_TOXGO|nr:hypothetical protein TGRUB_225330 [Toxoplasma gondii RUB]